MEKVYLTMKNAGVFNVVMGILLAVGSVAAAVGSAFLIMPMFLELQFIVIALENMLGC